MSLRNPTELLSRIGEHFDRLRPQTLRTPEQGKFIRHPYGVPAGFYQQLWDWDGFFINVHLASRCVNPRPEYFRYWVQNFVIAYRELGYPPGCVTVDRPESGHRGFPLKPFMAQSAFLGSQSDAEDRFDWLKPFYDSIVEIVTRRESKHRDQKTGLFWWDSAMASGADNNAADSNLDETQGLYLSCDLNAFQFREYESLAAIARGLNDQRDADRFDVTANEIRDGLQKHLWNESLGIYDNRRRDTGAFVNCVGYSSFVPLWAAMVPREHATQSTKQHLLQPHMMTKWGARSLSKFDRSYHNANVIIPYSNWRGPIWPIANYLYFRGLKNYGFHDQATDLACAVANLVLRDLDRIGSMHENYCAETGQPLAPSCDQAPHNIEGGFIGWNLLVQDMLEQCQTST